MLIYVITALVMALVIGFALGFDKGLRRAKEVSIVIDGKKISSTFDVTGKRGNTEDLSVVIGDAEASIAAVRDRFTKLINHPGRGPSTQKAGILSTDNVGNITSYVTVEELEPSYVQSLHDKLESDTEIIRNVANQNYDA